MAVSADARERTCPATRSAGCAGSEYLHYLRVREWQDLVGQLRQIARSVDRHRPGADGQVSDEPDVAAIHRTVLTGLLAHVGSWDEARRDYQGTRGARFSIWPGSSLARTSTRLVVAAELVETSKLWARTVAAVEPEQVEAAGAHLVKRGYSEPRWSASRGSAVATEKVTLLGVPIVAARTVSLARIDPELSRELFLRHGLVEGEWPSELCTASTGSSRTTGSCSSGSSSVRSAPAGATSPSTTRRCSGSTTSASPPRWCPAGTSTAGSRRRRRPNGTGCGSTRKT